MAHGDFDDCIDQCVACATACEDAAGWCRARGGVYAHPELMHALVSCAAHGRLIADYLRDDAELAPAVIELFVDVCDRAVAACERFVDPAPLLRACIERCAACRQRAREVVLSAEFA